MGWSFGTSWGETEADSTDVSRPVTIKSRLKNLQVTLNTPRVWLALVNGLRGAVLVFSDL